MHRYQHLEAGPDQVAQDKDPRYGDMEKGLSCRPSAQLFVRRHLVQCHRSRGFID